LLEYQNPLDLPQPLPFLGSNVESGSGNAVVIQTGGSAPILVSCAALSASASLTSFEHKASTSSPGWMIRFIAVMVPAVFLIND